MTTDTDLVIEGLIEVNIQQGMEEHQTISTATKVIVPIRRENVPVERKIFARNIRLARKAAKISQYDAEKLTGLSQSYISDVERCKVNISLDNMAMLARLVGTPLHELLKPSPEKLN